MKKRLIGALVGGLIIFFWQFFSFAAANLHKPSQQYTPKQDAIMQFMKAQGLADGGYFMPGLPDNATSEEHQKAMDDVQGKSWMRIEYHNSYHMNMYMNMLRGFLVNVAMVFLFISLLVKMGNVTMAKSVSAALATGLIVFMNVPYTNHIWYQTADIWAHLADAVVAWALTGLWLGWLLKTKQPERNDQKEFSWAKEKAKEKV